MDVTTTTRRAWRQYGAAIVEATIALPVLLVVTLAVIQFGFVYQAKATLNHAALQAARAGAVSNATPAALRRGLAQGLAPLSSPDASLQGVAESVARLEGQLLRHLLERSGSIEELMERTRHPAAAVASALALLEARGLVNSFGGATIHPTLAAKRLAGVV